MVRKCSCVLYKSAVFKLGNLICTYTGELPSAEFLKQKLSFEIQRGNTACMLATVGNVNGSKESFYVILCIYVFLRNFYVFCMYVLSLSTLTKLKDREWPITKQKRTKKQKKAPQKSRFYSHKILLFVSPILSPLTKTADKRGETYLTKQEQESCQRKKIVRRLHTETSEHERERNTCDHPSSSHSRKSG